jgi:hypothetical protein
MVWAHPNRVVSQAVFPKFAAGHSNFGAEHEVRASPLGIRAHGIAFKRSARVKKPFLQKTKKWGSLEAG